MEFFLFDFPNKVVLTRKYKIVLSSVSVKMFASLSQKSNTLVSGNAGEEKNLHPGGHNFFFFLISLIEFLK